MSTHLGAKARTGRKAGDYAPTVLLPGDPLRAKFIAEKFLADVRQINGVRGMLGYTGVTRRGEPVSVQGTGMGLPSLSIYVHELINVYGVKKLIRVGSCGSLQPDIGPRDIVVAQGACTDSAMYSQTFHGASFAPLASWPLLLQVQRVAIQLGLAVNFGNVLATDTFYHDGDPGWWKVWAKHKVLAVEMETSALYTLAARFGVDALSILTVSDSLVTGVQLDAVERERGFADMMRLALRLA